MSKSKIPTPDVSPTVSAEAKKQAQQKREENYASATAYKLSGVELGSILSACAYTHIDFARKFFNLTRIEDNPISKKHIEEAKQMLSRTYEAPPRATWAVAKLVRQSSFERLANHIINNENRIVPPSLEEQVMSGIQEKGAIA